MSNILFTEPNKHFIYLDYIKDLSLCDKIINFFESSTNKSPGHTSGGYNPKFKDSTDLNFDGPLLSEYFDQIEPIVDDYVKKYPACNIHSPWGVREPTNIQRYFPGQGYKTWHCERANPLSPIVSRHLVFMTYLNDVYDAGETEWYHQGVIVSPRKGLTVIWPSDWTHIHRGIVSQTETKYIVTGWFNYFTDEEYEKFKNARN